jgi:hypothetical protein
MATALTARTIGNVKVLTVTAVAVWFLLALIGSLFGVFDSEPTPPIPLGLFAVVPVAAYGVLYLTSARFRDFVLSLDLRVLTLAQTWRVGGIVFLVLYWQSALPGVLHCLRAVETSRWARQRRSLPGRAFSRRDRASLSRGRCSVCST